MAKGQAVRKDARGIGPGRPRVGHRPKAAHCAVQEIRPDMSLKEILGLMELKAEKALQDGSINPKWGKAISDLAGRRQTP